MSEQQPPVEKLVVVRANNGDWSVRRGSRRGPIVRNFGRREAEARRYVEQRNSQP